MIDVGLMIVLFQFVGRAKRTNLSIHHDTDAVAIFCLIHVVSGYENSNATGSGIVDEFPELTTRSWIHATRRFIKKHHPWLVEDGNGEGKLLLPPQRKRGNEVVLGKTFLDQLNYLNVTLISL